MRYFFASYFSSLVLAFIYSVFAISGFGVTLAKTFSFFSLVNKGIGVKYGMAVHPRRDMTLVHCFDLSLLYAVIRSKQYTVSELEGVNIMGLFGMFFGSSESTRLSVILSILINPWVFPGM